MTCQNWPFVVVTSFSDPRTRIFIKSQIWLVMPFFVLFYFFQWKPMKNKEKWRQTASQVASLRAHFWSSYKDFHQKSDMTGHAVFLSYFTFSNEHQWKTKKNDARQRARQPAWELIFDPRTRNFIKSQIWLVVSFFVLYNLLQWKQTKNQEKWRQATSQACSLSWSVLWSPPRRPPQWRNLVRNWWEPIANWGGLILDVSDWFWAGGFLACPMVSPT